MFSDRIFNRALLISLVIHGIILWFLPGMNLMEKIEPSEWLEVDLLPAPEVDIVENTGSDFSGESGNDVQEQLGDSELFPNPPVWVPERMNPVQSESVSMKLMIPTDQLPDMAGPGVTIPGDLMAVEDGSNGRRFSGLSSEKPPDIPWQPSQQALVPSPSQDEEKTFQITGEVSQRTVIYRPPAPRPTTSMSGTVYLKFWVHPDGTIGKIVPVMRGDPDLEQVAIEYLQKWRFETVDESVGRQSGNIPVRFRIGEQ